MYDTADQKEDGTLDDWRRDGGTNSTLRIKEQGMHLTLNEHDDNDDVWYRLILVFECLNGIRLSYLISLQLSFVLTVVKIQKYDTFGLNSSCKNNHFSRIFHKYLCALQF